jgi:hypothetical protein
VPRTPLVSLIVLLAVSLPAAAAQVPAGIPLWEGAKTGMSAQEVLSVFPEAETVPEGQRSGKRGPQQGELRARIDRVEVAGAPYRADFYFRGAGLERIILDRLLAEDTRFSQGLKLAGEVRDALAQHYGEPVKRETSNSGYLVEWHKGDKAVRLVVITQTYKVKAFQVIFEPIAGSD